MPSPKPSSELRDMIFAEIFVSPTDIPIFMTQCPFPYNLDSHWEIRIQSINCPGLNPNILQACNQLYNGGKPVLYEKNRILVLPHNIFPVNRPFTSTDHDEPMSALGEYLITPRPNRLRVLPSLLCNHIRRVTVRHYLPYCRTIPEPAEIVKFLMVYGKAVLPMFPSAECITIECGVNSSHW
jgi:hypothetical protein